MMIRQIDVSSDFALVCGLFDQASDYLALDYGKAPENEDAATEFFTDVPPGTDTGTSLKFCLFEAARLIGVADLFFGFPEPADAYIGLMLLVPAARGRGYGEKFLAHLLDAARARGANRILLAVLDANPRGQAFWTRMGFGKTGHGGTRQFGDQTHWLFRMARPL